MVNPSDPDAYGRRNLIRTGRSRRWGAYDFPGPLSIKGVVQGEVQWTTPAGRHVVRPDSLLVLPAGQIYSVEIDTPFESETFCAFFSNDFVGRARRERLADDAALLDDPEPAVGDNFSERLRPSSSPLGSAMDALARAARTGDPITLDWAFHHLSGTLAAALDGHRAERVRLDAQRDTTRREIQRRLWRGRDVIEAELGAAWTLAAMAGAARMAPHHFLRCFRQLYGETPRAFLARRRLERARTLLASGRYGVTDACFEVGYASLGSFSNAFSRCFGHPPSDLLG